MINFETATKEELIAYIEQQKATNKKVNKTTKLLEELQLIFNDYSEQSNDKLLWLHFLLSTLFSNLDIPVLDLLEKLETEPEEDDIKKVIIMQIKELIKSDDFKLRKPNKKVVPVVAEVKEVSTPL